MQNKLEQLEYLHSENNPCRPMITHTVESYRIPSKKKRQSQTYKFKQEIAANCEKYIRAKDTQVSLAIFPSEFKLVKPFVLLSFIFESTNLYKVFCMTHSWQLCCCRMRQICCDLMIRN